jgi:hypothetical protein
MIDFTVVMLEPMFLTVMARMLLSETRASLLESFLESQPAAFQVPPRNLFGPQGL